LAQSVLIDRSQQVSFKIDGAFLDAADNYGSNYGWQMTLHRTANCIIVNVPVSQDVLSYQFVMNTITQAWCRFTNWNASCWATLGDDIYYGGGTTVRKAWTGLSDAGAAIQGKVVQAYSYLGNRGQKQISLARPHITISNSAAITYTLDTDFKTFNGQTTIDYNPLTIPAVWDVSLWDSSVWGGLDSVAESRWTVVPGDLGYQHSFRLSVNSSNSTFTWTSTDYAFQPAGIL
jgi:hypothetical protein